MIAYIDQAVAREMYPDIDSVLILAEAAGVAVASLFEGGRLAFRSSGIWQVHGLDLSGATGEVVSRRSSRWGTSGTTGRILRPNVRQPSGFVCSTLRPDDSAIGFPSLTARRPRRAAASGMHLPICRAAQAGTLLDRGLTPEGYRGGIPFPSPAIRRDGRFWPTNLGQYGVMDPGFKASMCPLNEAPGPNRKTARHQYVRA
jgi:hypothetical protein